MPIPRVRPPLGLRLTPHHHRPRLTPLPRPSIRHFSSSPIPLYQQQQHRSSFFHRARHSWNETKVEWYTIPVGLGILVVAFSHIRKSSTSSSSSSNTESERAIRPMGAWQVQVLSTLPLKALSYYWGVFNEIPLPRILRAPGFKLYGAIFGVNMDEVGQDDLTEYRNLAEFFYRRLKPGVRPIDQREGSVVSPADGRVLQFGEVHAGGVVEQVKGMTYSLDALLGAPTQSQTGVSPNPAEVVKRKLQGKDVETQARHGKGGDADRDVSHVSSDEEFANVNGISYTLPTLLSGSESSSSSSEDSNTRPTDASVPSHTTKSATATVGRDLARGAASWWSPDPQHQKRLFFAVVYLAPGDYHRFHSPVNWVVESRRHFSGELYSVSPWLQNRLPGLFTLNERVVLLGRWRYGMFSMIPVGATNVGSIKIHFDRELRTNSLTHDPTDSGEKEGGGYAEASYRSASRLLGGQPIPKGGEMGGFNLGSTIVLVFEAPASFKWTAQRGQLIKVGEPLGVVEDTSAAPAA